MKTSFKILTTIVVVLSLTVSYAQIKNTATEVVKISGNCGMCKSAIEKAGSIKKIAHVDWNKETQMAQLTYDTSKTHQDEILKRIALAGYDNAQFLAPDEAYAQLPACCQYDRVKNSEMTKKEGMEDLTRPSHTVTTDKPIAPKQETPTLKAVFDNYFALKDALVKSDGHGASAKGKELLSALNTVQMNQLSNEEHGVWMKVMKDLKFDAELIQKTKDVDQQRNHFITLSVNIYDLLKVSKQETPTYYQHCPMANKGKGAYWLSKENLIKNPYYGSAMLTCGTGVETID